MRQVASYTKHNRVQLNLPQVYAVSASQPLQFLEWGRGTGKTTIMGYDYAEIVREMPRGTGLLIGPSYQFLLTRIIPSLVQGLEMFGLYKDLHYFIGKQPPRGWRNSWGQAYQPPDRYNNYITFYNGFGLHLISHDVAGDGRGLNSDVVHGDEAALLSPEKLQENTDPTRRGTNKTAFQGKKWFGFRRYTSSTPITPEGRWMLKYEEMAKEQPDKVMYLVASCKHNLHNLREGYLQEAEESAYQKFIFDAEYHCIRPEFTRDGFYSLLNTQKHTYLDGISNTSFLSVDQAASYIDCRGDADLTAGVPLILGVDWGAAINSLTINQMLKSVNEYRTLRQMYVLGDEQKIQDDLFADFHKHYAPHQASSRVIYLWYDNTGNIATGHTRRTRAEQAQQQLNKLGWQCQLMTLGLSNPMHELKYMLWAYILKEDNPMLPRYRMNRLNTITLQASMRNAKAVKKDGTIKKDKSSERSRSIPRQEATDLSDANDSPIFGMFQHYLSIINSTLPGIRIGGR